MTNMQELDALLVDALAKDTKRRSAGKDTEAKRAARERAAEDKQAEAEALSRAAELAKSDWRADAYQANMTRMSALFAEGAASRKALSRAEKAGDEFTAALVRQDLENQRIELSVLYALPIAPRDLTDTGRFASSVRKHEREVGMMAADALDVVMEAVRLCYLDDSTTEVIRFTREGEVRAQVPTIGGMYRNIKRANHMLIDVSRRMIREGVVPVSLDEMTEAGLEPHARMEFWGFDYAKPEDLPLGVLMATDDAAASRTALAIAKRRAERAKREAWEHMMSRDAGAQSLPANVDSVILRMLINGATLDQCADKLGVTRASLTRRLLALEPGGSNLTREPEGSFGPGVEWVGVRKLADTRKGWTHAGGTYAGPVEVRSAS